jgi:hypothetical protein
MRDLLMKYLRERRADLVRKMEEAGVELDQWVEEFILVDDFIKWMESVTVEEILPEEETRAAVEYRRSGLARRLRPEVDHLMEDGFPRSINQMLDELDEPDKSGSCLSAILNDWEYKGLYRRCGKRGRTDIWQKVGAAYCPSTPVVRAPDRLTAPDGTEYRLARD